MPERLNGTAIDEAELERRRPGRAEAEGAVRPAEPGDDVARLCSPVWIAATARRPPFAEIYSAVEAELKVAVT